MIEIFSLCFSIYSHLVVIYFPVAFPFIFTPAGHLHFTSVVKLASLIQHSRTNLPTLLTARRRRGTIETRVHFWQQSRSAPMLPSLWRHKINETNWEWNPHYLTVTVHLQDLPLAPPLPLAAFFYLSPKAHSSVGLLFHFWKTSFAFTQKSLFHELLIPWFAGSFLVLHTQLYFGEI